MYILEVKSSFEAAHQLIGYDGPCAFMHGHGWKVRGVFAVEKLDNLGIAIDFKTLKAALDRVTSQFDHKVANDILEDVNPTAENFARIIFERLQNFYALPVIGVMVEETEGCRVFYDGEDEVEIAETFIEERDGSSGILTENEAEAMDNEHDNSDTDIAS